MYDYNLLISYKWQFERARKEVKSLLLKLGDEEPVIEKTIARGVLGVKTKINNRQVIEEIRKLYTENPWQIDEAIKWTPVDHWCLAELEEMKNIVAEVKDQIKTGEKWAMEVEKRRYTKYHTIEIIKALADLIEEKVDLSKPDKILRIEIIGEFAGITVLKPDEIFSITKIT